MQHLFLSHALGNINLSNKIVMAPMTRSRALDNIPNDLMARYYAQRASAGLIITEGTSPAPNGLGYARIPGIFSDEQVEGWKKVTSAVHENGGRTPMIAMNNRSVYYQLAQAMGAAAENLARRMVRLETRLLGYGYHIPF